MTFSATAAVLDAPGAPFELHEVTLDDPRPQGDAVLERGGRVLVFTDGLVERQGRDIDVGLDALAAAAGRLHDRPTPELADLLVSEMLADEQHRDDVCLVCLTRT